MAYFLFVLIIIIIIYLVALRGFKNKKIKKATLLQNQWGMVKQGVFNFDHISIYAGSNKEIVFHQLSAQTKSDIDFNDIFYVADRTTSKVGQQYLYDVLSKPTNNIAALDLINAQANFFINNVTERIQVQAVLTDLDTKDAYFIATLLDDELPEKPACLTWLKLYISTTIIVIIFSVIYPRLLLWLMIPLAVNVFLHYRNKNYTQRFKKSFPQLNVLLDVCKKLSRQNIPFDNKEIKKSAVNLKSIQQKSKFLSFEGSSLKDEMTTFALMIFELGKAFFLVEIFIFYSVLKEVENKRADILQLFQYVGKIDMALSIASLRSSNYKTCTPVFLPVIKTLSAVEIYHPLITDCITNNIKVQNKSVLITGSNMSGKTTFLRTISLNAILAQTICTCFAQSYQTPVLKLHSSISINDNLLDAKSYYFEEVTVMANLIKEARQDWQNLFILDEVFKGTNTIERISAAKAILSFLNKYNNIVFVSTHDVELSLMLNAEYELYHFSELIKNDTFLFDHKLKDGPLQSSNAIKILALYNYPEDIIEEATAIATVLSAVNNRPAITV